MTNHFSIHFHQGEEALARRLAPIAEDVWRALGIAPGHRPPSHSEVVLIDQTEIANGFATPFPYDTILITASWPAGAEFIGKTDDWLRLVFSHEFTHIVHLDRSEGWARSVRGVFGRMPIAFPNVYLPKWQIEGLATYEESLLTGSGRLHAGDFGSIVDEAARRQRVEPLDRLNGGLIAWPADTGAYAYGAGFHEYLSDRFGADSLGRLADATARLVPFTGSLAFARVYGRSLGDLWADYEQSVRLTASAGAPGRSIDPRLVPRQVTHHRFNVAAPRFDRSPCGGCEPHIIYAARTLDDFPAMYEVATDGSAPRRLAERYLGSTSGVSAGTIYFDQQELRRSAGLYSDLYALDRATGRVTALTRDGRLLDPDVSPDGSTLAATQSAPGRRDLVLVHLGAAASTTAARQTGAMARITPLASAPDTQFDAPRWSPDGLTLAVERHRLGHQSEIVLVDVATGAIRVIASASATRFVTPAWRSDGRAVIAAADVAEGPFNLYEIAIDSASAEVRQLTSTSGGATWPDVSHDGRTIAFVGYTADGFELFVMPYPDGAPLVRGVIESPPESREKIPSTAASGAETAAAGGVEQSRPYNPLTMLAPTSWSPVITGDADRLRLGFATGGVDVLGYHSYAASATWLATSPPAAASPDAAIPDWQITYAYDRWRPTFWIAASADTSFVQAFVGDSSVPVPVTLREREVEGGVLFPMRHVRLSHTILSSIIRTAGDFALPDAQFTRTRTAWRAAWSIASARRYGYSISPEDGVRLGLTAEISRKVIGSSGDAAIFTGDGRVYWSPVAGHPHHVLAVRFGGGVSRGDLSAGRTFLLGGVQPNAATVDFGRNAISLLRGFGSNAFAGSRVALLNAEYRWPIARPQRGAGTWPLFVQTVHAAVFADTGHAWTTSFQPRDVKSSAGAELSADVVGGYWWPFTATIGAAWGRDGSRAAADGGSVYVRIGHSF